MSVAPEESHLELMRRLELDRWDVPRELDRVVVQSLDELRQRLPEDEKWGRIVGEGNRENGKGRLKGFERYLRGSKVVSSASFVGYKCGECQHIVIGPPQIEAEDTIALLAGRRALVYSCGNCYSTMHEQVLESS